MPHNRCLLHISNRSRRIIHCWTVKCSRASSIRDFSAAKLNFPSFVSKDELQTRQFSSAPPPSAGERRLAGRLRFYRQVGIVPRSPPWKEDDEKSENLSSSPVSAGVDGTQSATGVSRRTVSTTELEEVLSISKNSGSDEQSWFSVTLDGRPIPTPMGHRLVVPNEMLATAIAVEWDQQAPHLRPAQMPLTTLVCTALDQTTRQMESTQDTCLRFVATDTICYWEDPMHDRGLTRRQERHWQPVHDLVEQKTGFTLAKTVGSSEGLIVAKNTAALPHPPDLYEYAKNFTQGLNAWDLTILQAVTSECKSFWIGWALLQRSSFSVEQAIEAARVEEEYQIANWGMVEGGHDYDRLNSSIQIRAAAMLRDCVTVSKAN